MSRNIIRREDIRKLVSSASPAGRFSDQSNAETSLNKCPLSDLLESLATTSEEQKRLNNVDPSWFNVALKGSKRSTAALLLKAERRKRAKVKAEKALAASVTVEEQKQANKAVERAALRMAGGSVVASPMSSSVHTQLVSPVQSTNAAAAEVLTKMPTAVVGYSTVSYKVLSQKASSQRVAKWSKRACVRVQRSRLLRRLGGADYRIRQRGARRKLNQAFGGVNPLKSTIIALATAVSKTRALFEERLIGQRLPSSSSLFAATNGTLTSSLNAVGLSGPQRVSPRLAKAIASQCLPLVGADVSFTNRHVLVGDGGGGVNGKRSSRATTNTRAAAAKAFLKGRSGVVLHETSSRVVVALRRVRTSRQQTASVAVSDFSGDVVTVNKKLIKMN